MFLPLFRSRRPWAELSATLAKRLMVSRDHHHTSSTSARGHAAPVWVTGSVSQWASQQTQTGTASRWRRGTNDWAHCLISSRSVMQQRSRHLILTRAAMSTRANTRAPSSHCQDGSLLSTSPGCRSTRHPPPGPSLRCCLLSRSTMAGQSGESSTPCTLDGTFPTTISTSYLAHLQSIHTSPLGSAPSPWCLRVSDTVKGTTWSSSRH